MNSERSAEFPQGQFTCPEDVKTHGGPNASCALGRALERGAYTISDERKETTEFNLGKNVL